MWFHKCSYEGLSQTELTDNRVLEITLWDFQRGGSNEFIGGLRLGSHHKAAPGGVSREYDDSSPGESAHWREMLSQPVKWVERWHSLRPTMDPRESESTATPAHHKMKPTTQASPLIGHSRKTSSGSADMASGQGRYTGHSRKTSSGSADMASGQGRYTGHSWKTSSGSADLVPGNVPSSPPYGALDHKSAFARHSPLRGRLTKLSSGTSELSPPVEGKEKLSGAQANVPSPASKQEDVPGITEVGVANSHQPPSLVHRPEETHPSMKDDGVSQQETTVSVLLGEPVATAPETAVPEVQGRRHSREEDQAGSGSNLEGKLEEAAESFSEEVLVFDDVPEDESEHNVEVTDPPSPAGVPSGLKVSCCMAECLLLCNIC